MSLLVVEHKSTTADIEPGSDFWQRITTMDIQPSVYVPGLRAMGYDVSGVIYDFLRVPQNRPLSKPQPETPERFERRVVGEIAKDPDRFYSRGQVVRLNQDLEEGARDVWQTALDIEHARKTRFARNTNACHRIGQTPCEYIPICEQRADPEDPVLYRKSETPHEELDAANRDPRTVLSQSAMRCFRECPRRYQIRYEEQVRPIKLAKPLRRGKSIHGALNLWWGSGGDLKTAVSAIGGPDSDPFDVARERAMVFGYHCRWDKPAGHIKGVELEFVTDLVDPSTGAKSESFAVAGRVDVLVDLSGDQAESQAQPSLVPLLEASLKGRG